MDLACTSTCLPHKAGNNLLPPSAIADRLWCSWKEAKQKNGVFLLWILLKQKFKNRPEKGCGVLEKAVESKKWSALEMAPTTC